MTGRQLRRSMLICLIWGVAVVMVAWDDGRPDIIAGRQSASSEGASVVIESRGVENSAGTCFTVVTAEQPGTDQAAPCWNDDEVLSEAAVFVVTNTNDSGDGSLRWAIEQTNSHAGPDTVVFNIPDTDPGYDSGSGVWTIRPSSALPALEDGGTVIDGASQAAFIMSETNSSGPEIEIDGTNAGVYTSGLAIRSSRNVIRALALNRFSSHGIFASGADSNRIVGNYLGTAPDGTEALPNDYEGIQLNGGSSYNVIGGNEPEAGNLLSGNGRDGILIGVDCSYNRVMNNFIGTARDGIDPLGNGEYGVEIGNGSDQDTAHGNMVGPGNRIAFNGYTGLMVRGPQVVNNTIRQNSIHDNSWMGIDNTEGGNTELMPATILGVSQTGVTGTACAGCVVEIFSDSEDEGEICEGTTSADGSGNFTLGVTVTGPYVTATATDGGGSTSEFSDPFPLVTDIVVINTNDSGEGSLRWAMGRANSNAGPDTIVFNIPDADPGYNPGSGTWTIRPLSKLPTLTDNGTFIDGASQVTFIGSDTNPHGPEIEIEGTNAGNADGFTVRSANNVIQELVINRFGGDTWTAGCGIRMAITRATGNVVIGCYIGTDVTGMSALGNKHGGVIIEDGAGGNRIGGSLPAARNLICGTEDNVNVVTGTGITIGHVGGDPEVDNNDNVIKGNFIGVNRQGSAAIPNSTYGIVIYKGRRNIIGGPGAYEGNVISGNANHGLLIHGSRSSDNVVINNKIGTDAGGTTGIGNGGSGVYIDAGAHDNRIGPDNVIGHNSQNGIRVEHDSTTGNRLTRNSITANNDPGIDNKAGGNIELTAPVISSVTETGVSGTACAGCVVEIFSDSEDEGEICEGTTSADGSGNFTLGVTVTGPYVTATATDGDGNTSEFSNPVAFVECERGDVNCDGNITPGDALCTFWRAILGSFQAECLCTCSGEAAEVNCDGNITPGDALCIFWRAILGDWTEECECPSAKGIAANPKVDGITISSIQGTPGEQVRVAITVEKARNLDAFALNLSYPDELLQFDGVSRTSLTEDWIILEAVVTSEGVLTIGGFHTDGISSAGSVALVEVLFAVRSNVSGQRTFELSDPTDDLAGVSVSKGNITIREVPMDFGLSQNYPNPFNPRTTITYTLPVQSIKSKAEGKGTLNFEPSALYVTLKVFNVMGQEVATLVDEIKEPGYYTVTWDASQMASGVYFCRLVAGEFSQTRQMVLMK